MKDKTGHRAIIQYRKKVILLGDCACRDAIMHVKDCCKSGVIFSLIHILLNQDELNYHMMLLLTIWPVPIVLHCQNFVRGSSLVHLKKKKQIRTTFQNYSQKEINSVTIF